METTRVRRSRRVYRRTRYSPTNVVENGLLVLRSSNIQNAKLALDDNVYVNMDVDENKLTKAG